ncbi:MAG: YIP1 family protein [Parachlamydia sp.]|nr:YIP1 family protein [Parachlamydia sp.]
MEETIKSNNLLTLFFAIWLKPRTTTHLLLEKKTQFTNLKILLTLTLIYISQFIIFMWMGNLLPDFIHNLSRNQSLEFLALVIGFAAAISVILNIGTIIFYFLLKIVGGSGNFPETKTIIYWATMSTIPLGIFFLVFIWSGLANANIGAQGLDKSLFISLLQCSAVLGFFVFLIYAFIIVTKMLSEIHKIPSERTLLAVFASVIITGILGPLILVTAINLFK